MKVNLQAYRKPRIEMLPLIDIVFLLLVFFIYAMLSMAVHRGLPVILPTSKTAKIDKHLILSVTVRSNGAIYLDKERLSLEDLREALRKKSADIKETGILLFADRNLPYQKLFRVLDEIRLAGLSKVSLQAEVEEGS
ncbi:MAG: biopolymer transporter ExbD [Desulfobacteraceae bacterium]|jgi:biopolymer transport protein ExbD